MYGESAAIGSGWSRTAGGSMDNVAVVHLRAWNVLPTGGQDTVGGFMAMTAVAEASMAARMLVISIARREKPFEADASWGNVPASARE